MTTNGARSQSTARFGIAVVMGLSFGSFVHLNGSAVDVVAVADHTQSSDFSEKAGAHPGVCEREADKRVGQKAVRIGCSVHAPKRLRHVPPKYPEPPAGTVGSGVWLGEVLIDNTGKVAHVWPIREVEFVPPFPAFNNAITDALQQWKFDPLLVKGRPAAFCMTETSFADVHRFAALTTSQAHPEWLAITGDGEVWRQSVCTAPARRHWFDDGPFGRVEFAREPDNAGQHRGTRRK